MKKETLVTLFISFITVIYSDASGQQKIFTEEEIKKINEEIQKNRKESKQGFLERGLPIPPEIENAPLFSQELFDAQTRIFEEERNTRLMEINKIKAEQAPTPVYDGSIVAEGFSLKANELLWTYALKWTSNPMVHPLIPVHTPLNTEKHLNESYRLAWEEIYSDRVFNDFNHSKHVPFIQLKSALTMIASTNTISFLVDTYEQLLESNADVKQEKKYEIFEILSEIDATESLDAIFALLDLSDMKYGSNEIYQAKTGKTLRETIFHEMLNPKPYVNRTERAKHLARIERNRERIKTYQNHSLSEKNKALLNEARKIGIDECAP